MSITIYHYPDGWGAWCPVCNEVFSFGNKSLVEVEAKQHICPTSRVVDGAKTPADIDIENQIESMAEQFCNSPRR